MIIPSLLTENKRIAEERIRLAQDMSGWIHVDWLDDTLYRFESLPISTLETFDFGQLLIELHCMTSDPLKILQSNLSVERLIIHFELPTWRSKLDKLITEGVDTWLAIDPSTKIKTLDLPGEVGGVVIMGVEPGQTGQQLLPETFDRIDEFKDYYPDVAVTVDGGVNQKNLRQLIAHGVDNVIMGAAIFHQTNPVEAYRVYDHLSDPIGGVHDYQATRDSSQRDS